jgi:FkbM family methyltransferase
MGDMQGKRSIKIPQVPEQITLRSGTADVAVFRQVFLDLEYDFDVLGDPKFIIDAGAHIGLASLYFASRFPEAKILALEPEPSNFRLLKENTVAYANISPVQAGLWKHESSLETINSGSSNWTFEVRENHSQEEGVPAITVQKAMDRLETNQIDIFKMDIEGAEREVLQSYRSWIENVGTLVVELHGDLRKRGSGALREAVQNLGFEKSQCGENIVLRRKQVG